MCESPCSQRTGSCFDIDRMQESLKDSDKAVRIPHGLTAEEIMEFMLSHADREIEQQAHAPIPKSLHDRIQVLRSKADQLKE